MKGLIMDLRNPRSVQPSNQKAYLDSQMWLLDGEFSGDEKNPWLDIFSSSTIGPEIF
jgi:hypothetical protein